MAENGKNSSMAKLMARLEALESQFAQQASEQRALRAALRVHENRILKLEKRLDPIERESNVRAEAISRRLAG